VFLNTYISLFIKEICSSLESRHYWPNFVNNFICYYSAFISLPFTWLWENFA